MPRYQCLRCGASYYSASFTEQLLAQQCDLCECMQFRVSKSPVLAGVAADLGHSGRERAIEPGEHGCLPFRSVDEFLRFALPFIREGLIAGERVVYLVDVELDFELNERLTIEERRAIESAPATEQYGEDFEPERAIRRWVDIVQETAGPVRVLGGPDHGSARSLDPDRWHEYEQAVHSELERSSSDTVSCLCVYDLRACSDRVIETMQRTHPIIAGEFGFAESPQYDASAAAL